MALKPWYKVATPREDLREGKPLDASEFAVHLDDVRLGRAPQDYTEPVRFFERTYLTKGLTDFAAEVVRRLSGIRTETSAVFNLSTQFGGGKTHALALVYHLAKGGPQAGAWPGVDRILRQAGLREIPRDARTAVFVGMQFDSVRGRGGDDGTPLRKTPWGEIAWQLGREESFRHVAEHEREFVEPKGDVIRDFLPKDRPCLILMDEIINYVSTYRHLGYHDRLYNFVQALSETARGMDNVVLVVSIPASELEYTAQDEADQSRFEKMLDRVGKAVMISAESDTSEIIRRRLFEWDRSKVSREGRFLLPAEAAQTCKQYAAWVREHRAQLPDWFPVDHAEDVFAETYPFHPTVLSVFERKWQVLPRFQRTRGVLRLLALWVSKAYREGYQGAHTDPLISLGTAPLDDPQFRSALFEQLGENKLEGVVTTDIAGKRDANALRLDEEAQETVRRARLHRKVATSIFFESNGGQTRTDATLAELRLDSSAPDLDLGSVDTVLEALSEASYHLYAERNRYWYRTVPNLNKILADRRVSIRDESVEDRVRTEVMNVFSAGSVPGLERIYFPERSNQIPDRAALVLAILPPGCALQDGETRERIETLTQEAGQSARQFKSALLWSVPDSGTKLSSSARELLALEEIDREKASLRLDESQTRQLEEGLGKTRRDLREAVWRTYKYLVFLGKDNKFRVVDLGLVHSSASDTLVRLIVQRLQQEDELLSSVSPNFLLRNWPPAFAGKEWSTKAVRNAFYASPQFPRLLNPEAIKEAVAQGVNGGVLAYVGKLGDGYEPFVYKPKPPIGAGDVEISDEMYIITRDVAEAYQQAQVAPPPVEPPAPGGAGPRPVGGVEPPQPLPPAYPPMSQGEQAARLHWSGEIPSQKWMNFYTKVLSGFVGRGLRIILNVEVAPPEGISAQKVEEVRAALRELGLADDVITE